MAAKKTARPRPATAADAPLAVIILAAGAGKRMNSERPKVLQTLAGRPLLQYVIDTARALNPATIHVVYGYGGEAVREAFAHEDVNWVNQAQQLGTGHAVMQVAPQLTASERVLILNGDGPLITAQTLQALLAVAGRKEGGLLTLAAEDPSGYGRVLRDARGRVKAIVEEADATAAQRRIKECNSGVMTFPAARLKEWLRRLSNRNAQGEYYLTDVIALAVRDRVAVQPLIADEQEVQGINDRVQLAAAEAAWRARQVRRLMLAGATLIDPNQVQIRGTVQVGRDVVIDVGVVFEGTVILEDGVRIGPHCVLRNMTIGANTEVLGLCYLEDSRIGAECRIGPFARLRPKAQLLDRVHIGNFVEVKNSQLGHGTKANHFAYLGDATIGSGVNIGAVTVTCNYDGANKWRTEIGNDVFVGSGSMLVAPIEIGAGATIGAGSTLTRPAPAGELTLARVRQVTVQGWKRPTKRSR